MLLGLRLESSGLLSRHRPQDHAFYLAAPFRFVEQFWIGVQRALSRLGVHQW